MQKSITICMPDLIVFALENEASQLVQRHNNVHVVGVGKVNAAVNLTRLIYRYHPRRVINLGTAGGITVGAGIHRINRVVQHDVNLIPLGLEPGYQLNDDHSIIDLPGSGLTCATGDLFVTEPDKIRVTCDVVDMEAYSVARVCKEMHIECEIWKYISDNASGDSPDTWQKEVKSGIESYEQILNDLNVVLDKK